MTIWPSKTWGRNMGQLGIDCSQSGLVAGYNMVPRADGTIEDLSGNGNHGTINGPGFEFTEIGPSMKFDGVDDNIDCGAGFQSLTDVSVCMWIWPRTMSASEWFFNYYFGTNNAWGLRAVVGAAGYAGIQIYDDIDDAGAVLYSTEVKTDMAHFVVAQLDSLENKLYIDSELVGSGTSASNPWSSFAGNLHLGSRTGGTSATPCNISNVKIFNRALTQAEIEAEYNAGASAINFKTDYGVTETVTPDTSGELSNSPFRVESGSFHISNDTINGCSAKVIECVTAGVCHVPTAYFHGNDTQAAYGTFEWWINKATNSRDTHSIFIDSAPTVIADAGSNGYSLTISGSRRVQLIEVNGVTLSSLFFTPTAFVNLGDWNKFKATRSSDGEFTVYLNDLLVDVSGGSGTNPVTDNTHTESKYLVLDLGAGDKVAYAAKNGDCSIVKYQGVI